MRADPLTIEEGLKLGVQDIVRISAARQLYGSGKVHYETKLLAGDIGEIFELANPSGEDGASEDDDIIKALKSKVAKARADSLAHPAPLALTPLGDCLVHAWEWESVTHGPVYCTKCNGRYQTNSVLQQSKASEDKARKLKDLESKLESRQQELSHMERKERLVWFRQCD